MPLNKRWSRAIRHTEPGYTLIEIMVVTAIMGILLSVAISSYQTHTLKSKRYAAQACLLEFSQYMERFYTTTTAPSATYLSAVLPSTKCADDLTSTYSFALPSVSRDAYTLQATAKGTQTADSTCATMTLQQDGTKTPAAGCWP